MATPTLSGLRRSLVAVLIIALSLAGLGRALAAAAPVGDLGAAIPGVPAPICHAGAPSSDPSQPASHDCCDACALLAAALLPTPPVLAGRAPVAIFAPQVPALAWAPRIARRREPRLTRGPPAA